MKSELDDANRAAPSWVSSGEVSWWVRRGAAPRLGERGGVWRALLVAAVVFGCSSSGLEQHEQGAASSAAGSEEGEERSVAESDSILAGGNTEESPSDATKLDPRQAATSADGRGEEADGEAAATPFEDEESEERTGGCQAPAGISKSPRTIDELLSLLNALPKPTSVACFVESLERPLDVFLTRSPLSAQPAVGTQNPRVFVFSDKLQFTFVVGGPASDTLEFGFRHQEGRAVRGEIGFPIRQPVTAQGLVERIALVRGRSVCGNCHGEERAAGPGFFEGALESDVIAPASLYDVDLSVLETELSQCDEQEDAQRCELLQALLLPGQLRPVEFR